MRIEEESDQRALDLLGAVESLRVALHDLQTETRQQPQILRSHNLERLNDTVNSLGQERPAKPPVCADARQQWDDFLAGKRKDIEPRAVRFLCWEPDVATHSRFQGYLDRAAVDLQARALQGLVRSCHARWSPELCSKHGAANAVQRRLGTYKGANRVVTKWRAASDLILNRSGPDAVATDLLENRRAIKTECELWALEEQSSFVLEAVRKTAHQCRDRIGPQSAANQILLRELLPWAGWPIEDFKNEVGAAIVHPATPQVAELLDGLKRFVLQDDRLRDPRLPANSKNWLGVQDDARLRFIQWLSRDDIEFFFEHVLPRGSDPHGRKDFWLGYLGQVRMSRPLLNWKDQSRLQARMARLKGQIGNYGRIGGLADTSAFLLDFGPILVVEFSKVGNACYVYEKRVASQLIPDFWNTEPFNVSGAKGLKQPSRSVERVRHVVIWQYQMANILARYGIRPGSKGTR